MKSLFFLFFGTVFHRGLAEFYCVFSRCERLHFDQFPGRDMIVLCAFCVVLGSAVSLPDAPRASDRKDSTPSAPQEAAALRDFDPAYDGCGSESAIRRCLLNVRFARKRTRLGDLWARMYRVGTEGFLSTVVTVTPNFALLEMNHPEVASLVAAMLQARDAVERRSWSHPQEPTGCSLYPLE
jgi:hypothetical protein